MWMSSLGRRRFMPRAPHMLDESNVIVHLSLAAICSHMHLAQDLNLPLSLCLPCTCLCLAGIMRRVVQGGQPCLQVFTGQDGAATDTMRAWKALAEQAWVAQGHPGWSLVQERMVGVRGWASTCVPKSAHQTPFTLLCVCITVCL